MKNNEYIKTENHKNEKFKANYDIKLNIIFNEI